MRKIIALGIMLLFLGMTISSSIGFNLEQQSTIATFDGNILYVGGSGPGNYTKIQDAIDDSLDGDTVYVYDDSSPYYENLIVDKSINLIGEDKNSTIIDSNGSSRCIRIKDCMGGRLTGFTIQNAQDEGVYVRNCNDMNFSGNIIRNNGMLSTHGPLCGMRISESKNCVVSGNIFKNNLHDGLMIFSATTENNIVTGNVFENDGFDSMTPF